LGEWGKAGKQKTQAILADHPGFCSSGFPGEPVTPK
jgi:hypothetical protein